MKNLVKKIIAVLVPLGVIVALLTGFAVYRMAQSPGGTGEAAFVVKPGQSLMRIAKNLEQAGVVRSALYFTWYARRENLAKSIQVGEYSIPKNLEPAEVLDLLAHGRVVMRQFTVPEGKTLLEIAAIVGKAGATNPTDFIRAASNVAGMREWLPAGATNLEGVLYPETYTFTSGTPAPELVKMMTDRFKRVFPPLWDSRDATLTLKPYEVVVLASVVERETGRPDERSLIAAVFLNRLKQNIRLMSDPTVIYGIPNFNGNLTRADLDRPTAYNTYTQSGLPAGPICNPGAESIRAVLHPASTNYLYFVAKGDGSHQFSTTLEEHNAAVRQYQKGNR